jgi:hypothetical protein
MKNVIVKSKWMRLLGRSTCINHILGKFGVKVSIGLKLQQIPMEGFYEYDVDDDDDLFLKMQGIFFISITVFQCYTGYWFSVAFCHIYWLTVS